jgi:cytochrome b561
MSYSERATRYPTAVILMHWAIAAAVVGLVALGWWMQAIPKQPIGPRADAYNLHKSIGLAALLLMTVRLAWRVSHRPPELPPLPRWQARAAVAVHVLLYAAMFVAASSGYLGSATSGYPVKFFGWVVPSWVGAHEEIKDACSLVHLVSNWVLVAAIGAHVAASAYHQWVLRDGLLRRMWPAEGSRKHAVEVRTPG